MNDAARTLRGRHRDLTDGLDRADAAPPSGSRALVCLTATLASYPTATGVWYWLVPQQVGGTAVEGAAGSLVPDTGGFLGLHVGSTPPPSGSAVIAREVGGRWAFEYS